MSYPCFFSPHWRSWQGKSCWCRGYWSTSNWRRCQCSGRISTWGLLLGRAWCTSISRSSPAQLVLAWKGGNGERCLWLCSLDASSLKSFQHWMVHRAAPISVSITLGHTFAKCSESYSRGFNSQLVVPCIQLPFYILWMSSVRQEGRRYRTIFTVFSMTRPEFKPAGSQSWGGRSNHKAIKLVTFPWWFTLTHDRFNGTIIWHQHFFFHDQIQGLVVS